ncbi:diguanylate cyclase domain-containing protein [Planobispora longispora]|uniref:diguanylate cyclase domain-containing protein n=1 Tax=Planobispora longispora TaxID=28887 RepID=UPI0036167143
MLTLTTAATLGLWRVMIDPELTASGGQYTAEILLDASYMVGDVLIMAAVLLLVLSPGVRGVPTRLMIVAGFGRLVADIGRVMWQYEAIVMFVSGVIFFANALMVITMMRSDREELVRPGRRTRTLHPARIVFLGLALLTAPAIAVAEGSGSGGERLALLIATVAASGFVLTRFTVAVRQQERAEQLLTYQASYDPLTGLANRRTILSRLEESVAGDVLLYLDLDGFKAVNDTHGHEAGDALLVEIGNRLSGAVRDGDLVARLGGDEFALLCPGPADVSEITALAERLLAVVTEPVGYHGHELRVGTSIGIAVHAGGVTSPGDLIRAADVAMYQAKRGGRGRWVLAGPGRRLPGPGRLTRVPSRRKKGGGNIRRETSVISLRGRCARVPGPHLIRLRGLPYGWSRVVPFAERRHAHRPTDADDPAGIPPGGVIGVFRRPRPRRRSPPYGGPAGEDRAGIGRRRSSAVRVAARARAQSASSMSCAACRSAAAISRWCAACSRFSSGAPKPSASRRS